MIKHRDKKRYKKIKLPPKIKDKIKQNIKGNVLDIGTGNGEKLEFLLQNVDYDDVDDVVAIEPNGDLYFSAVSRFWYTPNIHIFQESIESIEYDRPIFDCVLMLDVIEHLEDPISVLSKINQLLKSGGVFICATPNKWVYSIITWLAFKRKSLTHIKEFPQSEFIDLVDSTFTVTEYMGTYSGIKIARKFPFLFKIYSVLPNFLRHTIYAFCEK